MSGYLMIGAGISISMVLFFALEGLCRSGLRVRQDYITHQKRQAMIASLPSVIRKNIITDQKPRFFENWNNHLKRYLDLVGWKIGPTQFLALGILLIGSASPFLFALSGDFIFTLVATILLVLVPIAILNNAVQSHYDKINQQLPVAIQLFVVEFQITKNILESLTRSAKSVEAPLRQCIEKCAKDLSASRNPASVFQTFADRLNCEYGRLWAQILIASTKDSTVVKLMPRLISRLSDQRILQQKNIKDLATMKRISAILTILIVPGFLFTTIAFAGAREMYATPLGKTIILLALSSVPVGMALDQLLRKVDY